MKGRDTMPASGISTPRLQRITDMLHTYLDDKKLAGMNALVSYRGQVAYKTCLGMMDMEANRPVQFDTICIMPVTATAGVRKPIKPCRVCPAERRATGCELLQCRS
jgi:hypothetical protein